MAVKFASGKHALAECDRCGVRVKLKQLKKISIKNKQVNLLVCKDCWEPSHPQLMLGSYPVYDPQALRNPRPDSAGYIENRDTAWGWNPVGSGTSESTNGPIDTLKLSIYVGSVTITT